MSARKTPDRCAGDRCDCPNCSYACGYEDARQEAIEHAEIQEAIDELVAECEAQP